MIHPNFNWKQFFMLNNALLTWNQSVQISEEMLNEVLESMRLTGQIVACEIGVSFKNAFSLRLRTKSQFVDFIHNACTQKPPENWSEAIYNWWCQTVPQLRQIIQESLADATPARKEAARASFDSFVDKMCKALQYLNRFYVKRLGLETVEQVASPEQHALRQTFGI